MPRHAWSRPASRVSSYFHHVFHSLTHTCTSQVPGRSNLFINKRSGHSDVSSTRHVVCVAQLQQPDRTLRELMECGLLAASASAIMVDGGLLREPRRSNFTGPRQTFASNSERWLHANNGSTIAEDCEDVE